MKALLVLSDQVENSTAIAGVNERDIMRPIGAAAAARLQALGWEARTHDPKKTFDVLSALTWGPEVVLFLHCDAPGHTRPQGVMGVMCSRYPDKPWATDVVDRVAAGLAWGVWGVSTDMNLCNYRYWFFRQMDSSKARRLVLEMVNMQNLAQATYLHEHADAVGALIADALHESLEGQAGEDDMAIDTVADSTVQAEMAALVESGIITNPSQTEHPWGDAASVGLVFTMIGRMAKKIAALEAALPGK